MWRVTKIWFIVEIWKSVFAVVKVDFNFNLNLILFASKPAFLLINSFYRFFKFNCFFRTPKLGVPESQSYAFNCFHSMKFTLCSEKMLTEIAEKRFRSHLD